MVDESHNWFVLPVLAFTNLELWLNETLFNENFRDIIRLNFNSVNDDEDDNDGTGMGWFAFQSEGVTH